MVALIPVGRDVTDPKDLIAPIWFAAAAAMGAGFVATKLATQAVARPVRQLRRAIDGVSQGDLDVSVPVDDGSEIGRLQAGFNGMVAGLREREQLRDLYGRQVGIDVAREALERGIELGGETREVSALFVDVVGSTQLAHRESPERVVALLNAFFQVVVAEVHERGGMVNKFEGDAALCVFGAPVPQADHAAPRARLRAPAARPPRRARRRAGRRHRRRLRHRRGRQRRRRGALRVHGDRRSRQRGGAPHRARQAARPAAAGQRRRRRLRRRRGGRALAARRRGDAARARVPDADRRPRSPHPRIEGEEHQVGQHAHRHDQHRPPQRQALNERDVGELQLGAAERALRWPRKPGTKNTNSTSTMFVTKLGTHTPTSDATGAVGGAHRVAADHAPVGSGPWPGRCARSRPRARRPIAACTSRMTTAANGAATMIHGTSIASMNFHRSAIGAS